MNREEDVEYFRSVMEAIGKATHEYLMESFNRPDVRFVVMAVQADDNNNALIATNCSNEDYPEILEAAASNFRDPSKVETSIFELQPTKH